MRLFIQTEAHRLEAKRRHKVTHRDTQTDKQSHRQTVTQTIKKSYRQYILITVFGCVNALGLRCALALTKKT